MNLMIFYDRSSKYLATKVDVPLEFTISVMNESFVMVYSSVRWYIKILDCCLVKVCGKRADEMSKKA